jgi:hypothetical protein
VQADPMRETGPGKSIYLQDVVQELDHLIGAGANLLHVRGLLDGVEIVPHMMDAAAGRRHDIVEAGEVAHEQRLGAGRFRVEPAVRHRLAAAGLIVRVRDVVAKPLQELKRRDSNLRKKCVDVARDKKSDTHASLLGFPWI